MQQVEYSDVFSFAELGVIFIENDILPQRHHCEIVKSALAKMTSNILNDKNGFVSDVKNKIEDECAVVQRHLSVFLDEILEVANRIICCDDSIAASNSSTELPQSKIKTDKEWVHRQLHEGRIR